MKTTAYGLQEGETKSFQAGATVYDQAAPHRGETGSDEGGEGVAVETHGRVYVGEGGEAGHGGVAKGDVVGPLEVVEEDFQERVSFYHDVLLDGGDVDAQACEVRVVVDVEALRSLLEGDALE